MTRKSIIALASGVAALTLTAAPAAFAHGYSSYGHYGHHRHVHSYGHYGYNYVKPAYTYGYVHTPVCVKFDWVYSAYGHAKWACVLWH